MIYLVNSILFLFMPLFRIHDIGNIKTYYTRVRWKINIIYISPLFQTKDRFIKSAFSIPKVNLLLKYLTFQSPVLDNLQNDELLKQKLFKTFPEVSFPFFKMVPLLGDGVSRDLYQNKQGLYTLLCHQFLLYFIFYAYTQI